MRLATSPSGDLDHRCSKFWRKSLTLASGAAGRIFHPGDQRNSGEAYRENAFADEEPMHRSRDMRAGELSVHAAWRHLIVLIAWVFTAASAGRERTRPDAPASGDHRAISRLVICAIRDDHHEDDVSLSASPTSRVAAFPDVTSALPYTMQGAYLSSPEPLQRSP